MDADYNSLCRSRKEIRVLVLEAESEAPLPHCSLQVVSLQDPVAVPYEAVSYAWGRDPSKVCVMLNGRDGRVPAAAGEVLQNFRDPSRRRTIWIDAICINQRDAAERAHQVALMGQVYRRTSRTLIWPGPSDEWTASAFSTLHLVYAQIQENTANCSKLREKLYGATNIFQYSTSGLPPDCDIDALRRLFQRPWFGRRWVVQEVALAPDGMVYCGDHSAPLLVVSRVAVWVHHKQHQLSFDLYQEPGLLNAAYMSAYVDHDQGWFSPRHGTSPFLADLLRSFRTFETSDPRDYIYALLGLSRWGEQDERIPPLLLPDYQRPPSLVIRDAAKAAIDESSDLWLFRYIEHGPPTKDSLFSEQPTWVPSLFHRPDPGTEPNPLRSAFQASRGVRGLPPPQPISFSDSVDEDLLVVEGVQLGSVDVVGAVFGSRIDGVERLAEIVDEVMCRQSLPCTGPSKTLATLTTSEAGLLLMGGSNFDPAPMGSTNRVRDIFSSFIHAIEEERANPDVDRTAGLQAVLKNPDFARCAWGMRYALLNRRLFVMSNGYAGLGPQATNDSDVVCVLCESRLPILLRRNESEWSVVGPCYVQGVMNGEAAIKVKLDGLVIESFRLR